VVAVVRIDDDHPMTVWLLSCGLDAAGVTVWIVVVGGVDDDDCVGMVVV
jgi:hypothetical protein